MSILERRVQRGPAPDPHLPRSANPMPDTSTAALPAEVPALVPTTRTRSATWPRRAGYWWLVVSALVVATGAVVPYLVVSLPALARGDVGLAQNFVDRPLAIRAALYVHVTFAGLALVLSPVQLAARVRSRYPGLHRVVGRTVLVAIVVGGVAGVVISTVSRAGVVGTAGFGLLGVLWVACALMGLRAIRRGEVLEHRRWMVRAFSLTYAGVTLRLWSPLLVLALTALGLDAGTAGERVYVVMPFLCWVPNLLLAEWWLGRHPVLGVRGRDDSPRRGRAWLGRTIRSTRGYAEMVAGMVLGMVVLEPLWPAAATAGSTPVGWQAMVMATDMSIGMSAVMVLRGHHLVSTLLMCSAMYAPFLALLVPYRAGWLGADAYIDAGHLLMLLLMLALMRRPSTSSHPATAPPGARTAPAAVPVPAPAHLDPAHLDPAHLNPAHLTDGSSS